MRLWFAALLAICVAPSVAHAAACSTTGDGTILENAAAGLGAEEWCEVVGMNPASTVLKECTSPYLEWQGQGYWDPINKILGFIGAAHQEPIIDCGSMGHVYWQDGPDSWTETAGDPIPQGTGTTPQHGNDNYTIDPETGKVYFVSGREANLYVGTWGGSSYSWDDTTPANYPTDTGIQCQSTDKETTGVGWDSLRDGIVTMTDESGGRSCFWDRDANSWSVDYTGMTDITGFTHKVVCSAIGGGCWLGHKTETYKNIGGTVTSQGDPDQVMDCCSGSGNVAETDPVSGLIITSDKSGGSYSDWKTYNLATNTWATISHSMPPLWHDGGALAVQNSTMSISTYGVIGYLDWNNASPKFYIYKHAESECNDSTDNDSDTMTDYPDDPGCDSPGDNSESSSGVFDSDCEDPSVLRCYSFENSTDITTGHPLDNDCVVPNAPTRICEPSGGIGDCTLQSSTACWDLDTSVKTSGRSALRFEIPDETGADTSGSFELNIADDYSNQIGLNEDVYVRFRYRLNSVMATTAFNLGDGHKVMIFGTGDQTGDVEENSCTDLESVIQTLPGYLGPGYYHACGLFWQLIQADTPICSGNVRNQITPSPGCCYNTWQNCWSWPTDEWTTIQMHVSVGASWNSGDARLRIWAGTGSEKALIWDSDVQDGGTVGEFMDSAWNNEDVGNHEFGKVWFLPYNTNKDSAEVHSTGYVWYDDLIISTTDLWDPLGAVTGVSVSGGSIR